MFDHDARAARGQPNHLTARMINDVPNRFDIDHAKTSRFKNTINIPQIINIVTRIWIITFCSAHQCLYLSISN